MIISTYVVDCANGRPAAGMAVQLERCDTGCWTTVARTSTGADGAVADWGDPISSGAYRLNYDTNAYFAELGSATFNKEIAVAFNITEGASAFEATVLVTPFAYVILRSC